MFTPEFWKNANKIGNALYRINHAKSEEKNYCEVDELYVFLTDFFPEHKEFIDEIYSEYADHVEEKIRFEELNKALNQNQGMKKEIKYKVMEAQL